MCFTRAWMWPAEPVHFLGLLSIWWMPRLTAESPTFLKGKTIGICWALRGVGPRLPELPRASFLTEPCPQPPRASCARRIWGSRAFSPGTQASVYGSHWVVTWVSSRLSEWCSKVSDHCSYPASPARRGGRWQRGPMWQLVTVGADVLVERKLTLGLLKPDKPDNLSLFSGSLLFLKGCVLGDPVTWLWQCLYWEKHLPDYFSAVPNSRVMCTVSISCPYFYRRLRPLPCFLCCSGRVLPS